MADSILVEKWSELIDTDKAPQVQARETMAQLLENQEHFMNEDTVQADIAQYTPILVPAVRRIFPNLLANEIVGVQPLKMPTGYAYALRYVYTNTNSTDVNNIDRGVFNRDLTGAYQTFNTVALICADPTVTFNGGTGTNPTQSVYQVGSYSATAVHGEAGKGLFYFAMPQQAAVAVLPGTAVTGDNGSGVNGNGVTTVVAGFQNEAGYSAIFKNFINPMMTATGEYSLGAGGQMATKSLALKIERVQVEAFTRKLKAEYTLEMAQDLKNIHGLDAEKELINIMEYEIGAELDRELVDLINTNATKTPTWNYGSVGQWNAPAPVSASTADGRWEAEKIRTLYNRLLREANQIALTTRRGSANFIIASSNVVAALETLQGFMYDAVPGQVKATLGVAKVGTLDGRFTVYMDTFAYYDYITLGYKGANSYDSGIIYCPYVPLQMQKVVDPDTFQPKIGFMTRDAIAANMYGVQNYYRSFAVNFTGSSFGGGYNLGQTW